MLDVFREEKKYLCNLPEFVYIKNVLSAVLEGDPFNGYDSYLVRSLYFDSNQDVDYFEKDAGLSERKKVRLRIYDPKAEKAKLELKAKSGSMQRKQSLTISKSHAIELINGNYEVLNEYEGEFASYMYYLMVTEQYSPKTLIEYDRVGLTAPLNNTRITFDSGVRAHEGNYNLFDDVVNCYPVISPSKGILEVKYNKFLASYIKETLRCVNLLESSASKYVLARCIGQGEV